MLISQYAGVGEFCPQFEVETASGGSLSAGNFYFSFQLQNRAGFNRPSVSGQVTYTANQKIVIIIPEMPDGWDVHYFVISAGTTNNAATHVQIARIPAYQYGIGIEPQSVKTLLPAVLELTRNIHIALAPSVPDLGSLPTGADRLDGQVRWVTSEAKWYEDRADSTLAPIPGNTDIYNPDSLPYGRWVRIGGASTYVSDTRQGVGSDRAIASVNPITRVPNPRYPGETLSKYLPAWEAKYWIYNDNAIALPAGTEFGVELEYNNQRSPDLLSGLVYVKFIGFVDGDGNIRTQDGEGREFPNCGAYFLWTPKLVTPFVTIDDLQPGEAIALAIKPFFSAAEFNIKDVIGVFPVTRSQSGDYNPLGLLLSSTQAVGGVVLDIGSRYRVVPNLGLSFDVLSGIPLVGSYNPPEQPRRTFGNLQPSTAGQKIVINGNGAVYAESPSYVRTASEGIRAIVGTQAGESVAASWNSYTAIASGQSIQMTLAYPCDANGYGTVRSDYPDVLAGNNKGFFNPYSVNIYLQRQDTLEIRRFSGNLVVAGTSQIITLTSWASGVVDTLPTADNDFSLFAPGNVAIATSIGGSFPVTGYRATYSFVYDGNQITKISHASPPCVYEWEGDFQPPTISIGTVTALETGENPTVVNSGTSNQAIFDFGIPKGDAGDPPTILAGQITSVPPFAPPSFSFTPTGFPGEYLINLEIPRGIQGLRGFQGEQGEQGIPGSPPILLSGQISSLPPFEKPAVSFTPTGTLGEYYVNFALPRGLQGPPGYQGEQGERGIQGIAGNVTSAAGALILDDSSATTVTLTSDQAAIRNINGELILQNYPDVRSEVGDRTVPAKLFLLSILR
ncbi:MAG: hypothetical protein RMY28_009425 [Nostoc sp. ChiSLP01]|nr:hypothetical protein [Nostoc sp. CmiSLP01]MDZ8285225.1 hypothetical protein [Nostoc sp. ChiSLP01]